MDFAARHDARRPAGREKRRIPPPSPAGARVLIIDGPSSVIEALMQQLRGRNLRSPNFVLHKQFSGTKKFRV